MRTVRKLPDGYNSSKITEDEEKLIKEINKLRKQNSKFGSKLHKFKEKFNVDIKGYENLEEYEAKNWAALNDIRSVAIDYYNTLIEMSDALYKYCESFGDTARMERYKFLGETFSLMASSLVRNDDYKVTLVTQYDQANNLLKNTFFIRDGRLTVKNLQKRSY